MSISYGLPFLGSKNKIAERIINILPEAEYFVDLFGGGGALTHCVSNKFFYKYKKIIYNELNTDVYKIFKDVCSGNIKKFDWLSHEEYNEYKHLNKATLESLILFSMFNNLNCGYNINDNEYDLYKSVYEFIFNNDEKNLFNILNINFNKFNNFKNDFLKLDNFCEKYRFLKRFLNSNNKNIRMWLFERFERCLNINRTLRNKNIEFFNDSYENILIPDDSVVICDIPYKGTLDYKHSFDYEKFYDWCLNSNNMIFICEYSMPDDFYLVNELKIYSLNQERKEKLFCNRIYEEYGINDLF